MTPALTSVAAIGTGLVVARTGFWLCRRSTTLKYGISRWALAHVGFVVLLAGGLGPIIFGVIFGAVAVAGGMGH